METRRAFLTVAGGIPFAFRAALAAGYSNAALLRCTMSLGKTSLKLDGDFKIVCALEARRKFVRLYAPLAWGDVRGFRLKIVGPDGKPVEPQFHPPVTPPATFDSARFHELDVGETVSFSSTLPVKSVFPGPGSFKLSAIYVPEPLRAATHVQDAIVFENGQVESGAVLVKLA